MPEGDTIYRSAERLRQVMSGRVVGAASDNGRYFRAHALVGGSFELVESRGKHLLMYLADGRVIHSHMGMTGAWHVYGCGEPWRKSSQGAAVVVELLAVDLASCESVVVCFWPKVLELLSPTQFRRHAILQRLGPDLMGENADFDMILARFRIHQATSIGEALMNQTIVSGVGNVYKSETLFLTQTNPFDLVGKLTDEEIKRIVHTARDLMWKNRSGYPRRTRRSGDGHRQWVYGRGGQPCFSCGSTLHMRRQGDLGRSTYWCAACQQAKP